MTGGQGGEEEILLRSHEVMRIHRRDGIGREESFLVLFPLSLLPYFPLHSILRLSLFLLSYFLLILSLLSENVLVSLSVLIFSCFGFFPLFLLFFILKLFSLFQDALDMKELRGLPSSLALWGFQLHLAGADLGLVQSEGMWGVWSSLP